MQTKLLIGGQWVAPISGKNFSVVDFEFTDRRVTAVRTADGQAHPVWSVVIAAGTWSRALVRRLGHQPTLFDTLPVIARCPRHLNVAYAFGHCHLRLAQAATIGRLVAELLSGTRSDFDFKLFATD